jgi:hypothetical protein
MGSDLEDAPVGCLKEWMGFLCFPLILWQSYETALEMHESVYIICCFVDGRPSS